MIKKKLKGTQLINAAFIFNVQFNSKRSSFMDLMDHIWIETTTRNLMKVIKLELTLSTFMFLQLHLMVPN